jgi:uncharacterized membrane protein
MAIGPVQLVVIGFKHPEFHGDIVAELERLRENDTVRVIDALAVHKDADGEIEIARLSNLTRDEAIELGTKVGALIGLGIEGEDGMVSGAQAGADASSDGVDVFSDEEAWDVLAEIPDDSAAALILLEHHCAVPLRDAIAGGRRFPHQRRLHQPTRPRRDRPGLRRRGREPPRHRDRRPARLGPPQPRRPKKTAMFASRRVARRTARRVARRR